MEIKGDQIWHSPSPAELLAAAGQEITLKACVHNIRALEILRPWAGTVHMAAFYSFA